MQSSPRRYHWKHRYLFIGDDLQQLRPISFDEPLQTVFHITWSQASSALYTHRVRQFNEIRVTLVCVRESVFIEKGLPLGYHAYIDQWIDVFGLKGDKKMIVLPCSSLFNTMILTPILNCAAVESSVRVIEKEASPSISELVSLPRL